MVRTRMLQSVLFVALVVTAVRAQVAPHKVVPLNRIPSEQWIEVVSGDPSKAGSAFVLRIHNDAGYVCPPHTHPTDENIVVVQGNWSVGMGTRINRRPYNRWNWVRTPWFQRRWRTFAAPARKRSFKCMASARSLSTSSIRSTS